MIKKDSSLDWPPPGIDYYYEDSSVCIIHNDCSFIIDLLQNIDIVVTDPPYGMNFRSNHRAVKHDKIKGDSFLPIDLVKRIISLPTVASYVFCRWDNIVDMPNPTSVIAWIKNNWSMGDLKHEHGRQWEACCFYPGPFHEFIYRIPDVIHADRTGNELHPTQKPVDLLEKLIMSNVGKVVLDPFAGSGTTAIAAKRQGRRCICIELEEKYCEIAAKRCIAELDPSNSTKEERWAKGRPMSFMDMDDD